MLDYLKGNIDWNSNRVKLDRDIKITNAIIKVLEVAFSVGVVAAIILLMLIAGGGM